MVLLIIIIILFDYFIYYDTNNNIQVRHIKYSKKPKVVIIGSQHGNEPAGSYIINEIYKNIKIKKGELIMFPFINKYGYYINSRCIPSIFSNIDLNRKWHENSIGLIEKLKKIIHDADLVIDCHEGWGFHISNKKSMGSSIFVSSNKYKNLCDNIVTKLNQDIKNKNKLFLSRGITNDLLDKPSLRTYCMNNNIENILIETTGINNVQDINIRKKQYNIILIEILKNLDMI